jgi:hypothetical protein
MSAQNEASPALHLSRWTVTSGSNSQSRGAVVIEAGDHHWRASAEGNGAVDALFKAVDAALREVLEGHPRLVGYDVHALAEGPEAEGLVIVAVQPPHGEGPRSEAYIEALTAMRAEAHWADAPASAGKGRKAPPETHGRRGELDKEADDSLPWVG